MIDDNTVTLLESGLTVKKIDGAVIVNGIDSANNTWHNCYFETEYPKWWQIGARRRKRKAYLAWLRSILDERDYRTKRAAK